MERLSLGSGDEKVEKSYTRYNWKTRITMLFVAWPGRDRMSNALELRFVYKLVTETHNPQSSHLQSGNNNAYFIGLMYGRSDIMPIKGP